MILLDTDVMIDVLRGYEPAKEWLKNAPEIGLPGLVVMELLQGCSNASSNNRFPSTGFISPMKNRAIGRWRFSRNAA